MRYARAALVATCVLLLSACGSLLATMQADTIEEDHGERTIGQMVEDSNIETKSTVNIHAANEAFHDQHVNVVSYNGYVLIVGQVATQALKDEVTAVVREVRGVRRIYNELEIAAPSSGMTRTSDT